ncbi:Alpha/Beta hydrolase protein [Protomyces lactucae-debilis]|uniref:Carboxypeptidase n=1 Tax=Protomyces lactucae-debilis TaxID=2754530 RepID=A0A1Y2FIS8_PROLT|nr:Alpha/Beta hydrolase protein [Protomyces lactucae-debilis]ORY83850.1 Alpha/Beta hydrolase protein [Protomyces lactucae-debilis]
MYWTPLLLSHLAAAIFSDGREPGAVQVKQTADSCLSSPQQVGCKTEWLITDRKHPGAILRINKTDTKLGNFCEGAGAGHTGYLSLDHGKRNIYFAFFESRSSPLKDPLALWLQGGPGTSGTAYGLLLETGPCSLYNNVTTQFNPYSWNHAANTIYVDQPIGVGYSFSTKADPVGSRERAADGMIVLLHLFNTAFPQLRANKLHITGESYAGKWIPSLAMGILDANKHDPSNQIVLGSVVIGGGYFSPAVQDPKNYDYACLEPYPLGKPLFNKTTCAKMKDDAIKCAAKWAKYTSLGGKNDRSKRVRVGTDAINSCYDDLVQIVPDAGLDLYKIDRDCPDKSGDCDPRGVASEQFLKRSDVAFAFGAGPGEYHAFSDVVYWASEDSGDEFVDVGPLLGQLLEAGIPMLLYAGMLDYIVNHRGIEAALEKLVWSGSAEFKAGQKAPTKWSGGVKWKAKNLLWVLFNNAGHVVPEDDPASAFEIFNAWIDGLRA